MFSRSRILVAMALVLSTGSAAAAQSKVTPVSNTVKYKHTGTKPATGRSGSAALEARALIAKNGRMQVEASTGALDTGVNPGTIAKAQIKIGGFTKNYNTLDAGGYFTDQYPAADRGSSVQVQANIRGIDPKRTDVVTVSTPALLRPDVAVTSVSGQPQAAPHALVSFTGAIAEKNGDVGATASCVFAIDGTDVDAVTGLWVDAGDTVNCQFNHVFATAGTYTVRISATGIVPGDWDDTNNQATATITILEPSKAIQTGSMRVEQRNTSYYHRYSRSGYYYYNYNGERTDTINRSLASMNGWEPTATAGPAQRVDVTLYKDGSQQHQASLLPVYSYNYDSGDYFEHCSQYYEQVWDGSRWIYSADRTNMCSGGYRSNPSNQWTNYWYERHDGTVTYYGHEWSDWYGYYTWNNQSVYGNGVGQNWAAGSVIRLKLDFVDGVGMSHTADQSVTLENRDAEVNYSGEQWYYDYWYGGYYYYDFWQSMGRFYYGSTSWNNQ